MRLDCAKLTSTFFARESPVKARELLESKLYNPFDGFFLSFVPGDYFVGRFSSPSHFTLYRASLGRKAERPTASGRLIAVNNGTRVEISLGFTGIGLFVRWLIALFPALFAITWSKTLVPPWDGGSLLIFIMTTFAVLVLLTMSVLILYANKRSLKREYESIRKLFNSFGWLEHQ